MATQEDKYRWLNLGDPDTVTIEPDTTFSLSGYDITTNVNLLLQARIKLTLTVTNDSSESASTTVTYKLNNTIKDTQYVTLAGGASETITLDSGTINTGSYDVIAFASGTDDIFTDSVTVTAF